MQERKDKQVRVSMDPAVDKIETYRQRLAGSVKNWQITRGRRIARPGGGRPAPSFGWSCCGTSAHSTAAGSAPLECGRAATVSSVARDGSAQVHAVVIRVVLSDRHEQRLVVRGGLRGQREPQAADAR